MHGSEVPVDPHPGVDGDGVAPSQEGTPTIESPSPSIAVPRIKPHFDPHRDVVLRIECMSDSAMKRLTIIVWVTTLAGLALVLTAVILKSTKGQSFFLRNYTLYITNTCVAATQIFGMGIFIVYFVRRLIKARRSGRRWDRRRLRTVELSVVELILQMINSILFLAPNVIELATPCSWFDASVQWLAFGRWTCWNSLFFLFTMQASNLLPLSPRQAAAAGVDASTALLIDSRTLWVHWRKLPMWVSMEGLLLALTLVLVRNPSPFNALQGASCQNSVGISCGYGQAGQILSNLVAAWAILYLVLYLVIVWLVFRHFYSRSYIQFRVGNLAIRLQIRLRGMAFAFFIAAIVGYFYVDRGTCSSYILSWYGLTPMQFVMTVVAITQGYLAMPTRPNETAILQVWFEEFAWTESDIPRKIAERSSCLPAESFEGFCMDCEPIFCFETAIKLMYWSYLAYDTGELPDSAFTPEKALTLFDLENFDVVWEHKTNAKAVIGWKDDTIVIAFRGTATVANVVADLQLWRTRYPPEPGNSSGKSRSVLGTAPMVHRGFLKAYTAGDFNHRLLSRVEHILNRCQTGNSLNGQRSEGTERPISVHITGHSLGGALAILCAFDIATRGPCAEFDLNIKTYTFGAPRVGNHAWARIYDATVPDTWQIINSGDPFPQAGKFWFLYKHVGHRVLINRRGDMLVRPSFVEYAIRRSAGAMVRDHYLTAYQSAFISIVAAQFGSKSLGNREEVMMLAQQERTWEVLQGGFATPDDVRRLDDLELRAEQGMVRPKPVQSEVESGLQNGEKPMKAPEINLLGRISWQLYSLGDAIMTLLTWQTPIIEPKEESTNLQADVADETGSALESFQVWRLGGGDVTDIQDHGRASMGAARKSREDAESGLMACHRACMLGGSSPHGRQPA